MLDAWMKTGHATWISLITSLKISGFGSLAQRLAITYGNFINQLVLSTLSLFLFFAYADIPSLDSPTHMKGKNEVLLIIVYAACHNSN